MTRLTLYTDFVCPYCFIAEQSTVAQLLAQFELELDWHGFELHPNTPPGGVPLERLFPGVPVSRLHEQVQRFGAGFGVVDFTPPDQLRSSKKALAIAEFARDLGHLEPYRQAVFQAHWRLQMNIESNADLARIAQQAGLDPDAALAASSDPLYLERVNAKQAVARQQGVSGIPTFVIGSQRVTGCQPLAVLAAAAQKAGAASRPV